MQNKQTIGKIVFGISTPTSLLLLIFFFLPWLNLTCSGQDVGEASGFQLAKGEMTQSGSTKTPGKLMGEMMGGESSQPKIDEKKNEEDFNKKIKARPWCYLGLIIPVILLVVGLLGLKSGAGKSGILLILLGIVGIIVITLASGVEYTDDFIEYDKKEKAAKAPEATRGDGPVMMAPPDAMQEQMEEQMKKSFETSGTKILGWSLVLYILIILCGLANVVVSKMSLQTNVETPDGPAPPVQA